MTRKLTSSSFILAGSLIVMAAAFMLKLKNLPPQIPLFYSRLEGDDQIADLFMIFLLPGLSLMTVLANNFIAKKYFGGNHFVTQMTYYVNLTVIGLALFIFLRIIFLVA